MTYTSNPKNATSKRKKSTISASSSATVEYKWTPRSLKVSQTGPSPVTQQKSVNSLDLRAIIDTSSKDTQKLHAHYWILQRKQSYGTGESHNTKCSKNSRIACAPAPSSHNPISINHAFFKPMHRLMAWVPYSRKRVNTMRSPPKNPNYIPSHSTRQPSPLPNETTISMNENS